MQRSTVRVKRVTCKPISVEPGQLAKPFRLPWVSVIGVMTSLIFGVSALGCNDEVVCADNHLISSESELAEISVCTQIEGDLEISGSSLTDLEGLQGLTQVGGCLRINGNDALVNLDKLESLQSVGGCVEIQHNDQLVNFNELRKLSTVSGNLAISFNESLTDLSGLSNITSVKGNLDIEYNPLLANIDGLARLSKLEGYLKISRNDTLNNLKGLGALDKPGGALIITYNPQVTGCEVNSLRDRFVAANPSLDATIKGNNESATCP